jgi:hypothetical protein
MTLRIYTRNGALANELLRTPAAPIVAAAFAPRSHAVAFVQTTGRASTVWLYPRPRPDATAARKLFFGAGSFTDLLWAPDGRWLLLGWRSADQWLFVRPSGVAGLRAFSQIAAQFAPGHAAGAAFPRLGGWCCAEG